MRNVYTLGAAAALMTTLSCGTPEQGLTPATMAHAPSAQRQTLVNGAQYALTAAGLMGGEWLCVDIRGGSKEKVGVLQLWECNSSEGQSFKRVGLALQAFGSKCLDVAEGQNFSGAKVHMMDCEEGAWGQSWVNHGRGLQLKGTELCLDVTNGLANQGAGLQVWKCEENNGSQMFDWKKLSQGNSRGETDDATVKNISGRKLMWNDEFEEDALDDSKWVRETPKDDTDHNSGKNKEEQRYTDDVKNSFVEDGKLHIKLVKDESMGKSYSSARLSAKAQGGWTYGRIETRLKVPCGQGLRSVAWLRPSQETFGPWPKSGELDFMEILGGNANTLHATAHFGDESPNNKSTGDAYTLSSGTFCNDFHVYAIERTENEITWLLDDTAYYTLTPEDAAFGKDEKWPFDASFDVVLSVTMGGKWPGKPGKDVESGELVVDYVRVYGPKDQASGPKTADQAHSDQGKEAARPKN